VDGSSRKVEKGIKDKVSNIFFTKDTKKIDIHYKGYIMIIILDER
jgi:hypothetical protein